MIASSRSVLSPLRYPGGKRRLVPYVKALLQANRVEPDLFLEPFAGGASVALELAATGTVEQIALADLDPWIASFWQTVFWDCDWLCGQVQSIEVDLATWDRFKRTRVRGRRGQALACLFLNRTSFNGALHRRAGPIGGRAQVGRYDIACRFPRERLVKRLRACEQLALEGRVAWVREVSALEAIGDARAQAKRSARSLFTYLDPPFWAKSRELYRHSFTDAEHGVLAQALRWLREPWLLSYDVAIEIEALFAHHDARHARVELLYSGTQRTAYEELVITSLSALPADTRLWRTVEEWSRLREVRSMSSTQ